MANAGDIRSILIAPERAPTDSLELIETCASGRSATMLAGIGAVASLVSVAVRHAEQETDMRDVANALDLIRELASAVEALGELESVARFGADARRQAAEKGRAKIDG